MNKPQNGNDPVQSGDPAKDELDLSSADIVREAAQIAGLHQEVAELKDRYLRAVAEVENVRKRAEREKVDAAQFAFGKFARDLLNVVDNFSRAFEALKPEVRASMPTEVVSVVTGIEATQRELFTILERHGIKRIEAQGLRFNPNLHQAVAEVPSREHPPGTVLAVAQEGYMIGGRLLREAIVAVSTAPVATTDAANGDHAPK
ncbi:MAG: nucleotide exchange factor GrpE [Alphaproteobacteria bacterium]|nr:nucleotide exchange factor GrpE [Alphaproteobacteria bacterium]